MLRDEFQEVFNLDHLVVTDAVIVLPKAMVVYRKDHLNKEFDLDELIFVVLVLQFVEVSGPKLSLVTCWLSNVALYFTNDFLQFRVSNRYKLGH